MKFIEGIKLSMGQLSTKVSLYNCRAPKISHSVSNISGVNVLVEL